MTKDIVVVTTSYYSSDSPSDTIRAGISKRTVKNIINAGHQVIIVDGGSSELLLQEYKNAGARVYTQQSKGMGSSRREAISHALKLNPKVIVWMEIEKQDLVSQIEKLIFPIINGTADFIIPKRISLDSYPPFQQYTENAGNLFWKDLTKTDLDVYFGPRVWKSELSHYFLDYKGEYGDKWDSIFIPVLAAMIDGKKIESIETDYIHPHEQTEIEDKDLVFHRKRIEQLTMISQFLYNYWNKIFIK